MSKFEINSEGVRALLRSSEMMDVCQAYADEISGRCSAETKTSQHTGNNRVNVSVSCSMADTQDNELLKAVRG